MSAEDLTARAPRIPASSASLAASAASLAADANANANTNADTNADPETAGLTANAAPGAIDLVVIAPRVITMDARQPDAQAFAVSKGRIVAVGSEAELADEIAAAAQLVRITEGVVFPGLVDAHAHPLLAGIAELFELVVSPDASVAEVCEAVSARAATLPDNAWILGGGWGTSLLPELSHESALRQLDGVSGGHPVLLVDDSRHNRWANSAALARAGITASTSDPERGQIVRDPDTHAPTGLLFEGAGLLVDEIATAENRHSPDELEEAAKRALGILHCFGITSVMDAAASHESMGAFAALDRKGELAAHIVSCMAVNDQVLGIDLLGDELIAERDEFATPNHRTTFIKIFLDGTPPAFTGAFLHPYVDDGHHGHDFLGEPTMSFEELSGWLLKTAALGISAKIHCSGDASVRMVLDAVQKVREQGFRDTRYHIAHGQFIDPDDLPRLAHLGVVAEASPFFWVPGVIADALATVRPADEIRRMHPNRTLLDSGAVLAVGSDWPVSPTPDSWYAIQGLVTRQDPSGVRAGTLVPTEAVTVAQALAAVTSASAYALGLESEVGGLGVGKAADFIVLDRDPLGVPASELASLAPRETWVAGKRVYARPVRDVAS